MNHVVTIEQCEQRAEQEADGTYCVALERRLNSMGVRRWLEVVCHAARGPVPVTYSYCCGTTPVTRQQAAELLRKRNEELCR